MRAVPFAAVVLVGALTAGCSGDPAPPAGPGPTSGSRTSLAVPAVPDPLDASGFREAPCDLLSERQAGELGLPFAQRQDPAGRMTCAWRADKNDPNSLEALTISLDIDDGLAGTARLCSTRTECDSWTVDKIAGYPMIRANGQLESKYGACRLFVGVADNASFMVADGDLDAIRKGAGEGDAGGPRCDRADRAAAMVIQTQKPELARMSAHLKLRRASRPVHVLRGWVVTVVRGPASTSWDSVAVQGPGKVGRRR